MSKKKEVPYVPKVFHIYRKIEKGVVTAEIKVTPGTSHSAAWATITGATIENN